MYSYIYSYVVGTFGYSVAIWYFLEIKTPKNTVFTECCFFHYIRFVHVSSLLFPKEKQSLHLVGATKYYNFQDSNLIPKLPLSEFVCNPLFLTVILTSWIHDFIIKLISGASKMLFFAMRSLCAFSISFFLGKKPLRLVWTMKYYNSRHSTLTPKLHLSECSSSNTFGLCILQFLFLR